MPSSKGYLDFILDQLRGLEGIDCRHMMGEYILYYNGRIVGGIYDDRLLLKPTPAAHALLPDTVLEAPYEGAKPQLLVDEVDDSAFLQTLIQAVYAELPASKGKKGK